MEREANSLASELYLTPEEMDMLSGTRGIAIQRAIEIVVALAKIYGATSLVPVASVQVAGVSYKNLGESGLEFLQEWAAQGARVCVPTTLNPAGIDLQRWQLLGFSPEFARQQAAVIRAYTAMGIVPTCTCTPYLVDNLPAFGQHVAWAESSAVSFANSVLGARTNREGGPSALAAAICGRTAAYGLHLDHNRLAHVRVDVYCPLRTVSDWSALGYLVGRQARDAVPYFVLHDPTAELLGSPALIDSPLLDELKSLGAAMAASGAVALYHIDRVTPEACQQPMLSGGARRLEIDDLSPGYRALNQDPGTQIDLVSIGCPHASPGEILQIAQMLDGKQVKTALWVTTARETRQQMDTQVQTIQKAGAQVVADTCLVVAPVEELGFRHMATNSAKMAFYAPAHSGLHVHFGSLEQCIQAALSGRWLGEEGTGPT
jgi:predicted aconitase